MNNKEIVDDLIDRIKQSVTEVNPTRALIHIEEAKKIIQDLYYELWIKHHESKTS